MSDTKKSESKLGRLTSWFRNPFPNAKTHLVEAVPNDIALCEFDCSKTQCRYDEWESCGRRLRFERLRQEYEERTSC